MHKYPHPTEPSQSAKVNRGRQLLRFAATLVAVTLTGCGPYAFTLNEQPIYTPPPLFSDYELADRNLYNCVQQTIADRRIRDAEALTRLECTYGGIASLEGIEVFRGLRQLNLAHNQLGSTARLLQLPALERVRLTDNPQLDCAGLAILRDRGVMVEEPEHCS